MPASRLGSRPVPIVLAGAVAIAFSGILYRYSEVSPSTGGFFRCLWALPPLWLLARNEDRRFGSRPLRAVFPPAPWRKAGRTGYNGTSAGANRRQIPGEFP